MRPKLAPSRRNPHPRRALRLEPLEDRRILAVGADLDFGDAPAPYPTTLDDDGPRHEAIGPTLGPARDAELDGQPTTLADGDGADEDGVTFGTIRVGQLDASVTVNVQSARRGAKLDAWIDFNGDGSWGGPGEQIFDRAPVNNGDNAFLFDVPSWAIRGDTYARFRLSTAGDLGLGGLAANGEVEDYQVTIDPPAPAPGLFVLGENIISADADGARSVFATDVDGDGDIDVLSASFRDDKIAWYENDGSEGFTAHTISTDADFAWSVFAADVDGDGDIDVLSASLDDKIAWYENDGSEGFTAHTISTDVDGARSVFAADVDGDGDIDVLSASGNDDKIAWYENDGSEVFTAHTISTDADFARSVFAADVDGDGDMDVLSASGGDGKIAWYENDGSEVFTAHIINSAANGASDVFAADVDGDGDIDVLSASSGDANIAWHENDGSENFTTHTISTGARSYSVFAADADGDGDVDVLGATPIGEGLAWYENDGSQGFTVHTISPAGTAGRSVFAADMDGDGDIDVLSESRISTSPGYNKIVWYENVAGADFGDAPVPYPTRLANGGAVHHAGGPTLGPARDLENNGQPTLAADGDGTDDDGVTFGSIRVGQLGASVTVNVQNAPDGAKLDAWIDFNGDGNWGGADEHIAAGVRVSNGDNEVGFYVPSGAISGEVYARFRISTEGDLGIGGAAADGEVEDYRFRVDPPARAAGNFVASEIGPGPNDASLFTVAVADLDGDGDMDVIHASGHDGRTIIWYQNFGGGSFARRTFAETSARLTSIIAADVDGDGDLDVVTASYTEVFGDPAMSWYENNGTGAFAENAIDAESMYIRGASLSAADMDGDGDIDLVRVTSGTTLSFGPYDPISWFENHGSGQFTEHFIDAQTGGSSVAVADVDGDGDLDVLSISRGSHYILDPEVYWFENDGSQNFSTSEIETPLEEPYSVIVADVDGDGRTDVLSADGSNGGIAMNSDTIISDFERADSLFAADVDGDGDLDVLGGSAWFENLDGQRFMRHSVDSDLFRWPIVIAAADMDGDGDLDLIGTSRGEGKLIWFENVNPPPSPDLTGDGSVDFRDLTLLLSNWNQKVLAEDGNLVDAAGSAVDFADLTALLAAWGPAPTGAPQAAVVGGDFVGNLVSASPSVAVGDASYRRSDEAPRQAAAYARAERRETKRFRSASGTYEGGSYRRLQAVAVDRVLEADGDEGAIRSRAFARRARRR